MFDFPVILGIGLIVFGVFALLAQSGNFVTYRLMRNLKHHGVDGQAVYKSHEYANPRSQRVYFDVRLPEGEPRAEFHEYMQGLPGPEGTVVPVVYDRRKPRRAKTGTRKDLNFDAERLVVLFAGGTGLALLAVGVLLCIVGAVT
ncbi:DUF3592 domain-containing protein [Streptomyces sp. V4I2]|uniref:DUF3592 domain-containing protein n=1 Tax=Streptomyces sp. V4I2 TaxID=3042280 RepID=UPI002781273D|nr:DUF3592 domain-containing protein [Streptomyces sp. V4I2]MDQ1047848.1 hypothetical protein [Streptomyces sp. V4I2]